MWGRKTTKSFVVKKVVKRHERTANGVRFNVQSVKAPAGKLPVYDENGIPSFAASLGLHFNELALSDSDEEEFEMGGNESHPETAAREVRVEAHSLKGQTLVDKPEVNSLMHVVLEAFANHYPLSLSADDIWIALIHAVMMHIQSNAEELRERFVRHEGKVALKVRKDDAVMGEMSEREWEREIFRGFSEQIKSHVGDETYELLTKPFSTTTKRAQAAFEVTLMSAMKNYFGYTMVTLCGVPWIELRGTEQDWIDLRKRAAELEKVVLSDFAGDWLPYLLPVLDEFICAYRGDVKHEFWQRMCKLIPDSGDSGDSDKISGWINNFYPYLNDDEYNLFMKPWQQINSLEGPDPQSFPELVSSVPVVWEYYEKTYRLHFHAGYLGMAQDASTLALSPNIGWIVTHDPPEKKGEQCMV